MPTHKIELLSTVIVLAGIAGKPLLTGDHELPALIVPKDILLICGSAWIVCILGGLIPAWRAGRLKPVEALRYE